jgi:glycosyl transferase family 87
MQPPVAPAASPARAGTYLRFAVCVLIGAGLFARFGLRTDPVDNEVFNLWAGARLGPQKIYDPESFRPVAASLGAHVMDARLYYCRMPYYAVLTRPLGWFAYPQAVALWRLVQALAIVAAVFLWPGPKLATAMVAAVSLPAIWVVSTGQDAGLILLFAAGSVALLRRGQPVLAGAVFSLCLGKPHLVIFIPLAMLAIRNFRFLAGAAAGALSQIFLSFAVAPLNWPYRWLAILSNSQMHPYVQAMPGLRGLLETPFGSGLAVAIAASLAVAVWKLARSHPLEETLAYALAAGVIANLHSYGVDCILLIPMVALAVRSPRFSERALGILMATPVPYLALVAGLPAILQTGVLGLIHLPWAIGLKPVSRGADDASAESA